MTDYGIISYGRWNKKEKIAVVLNNNSSEKTIFVPVWKMDIINSDLMESILFSDEKSFDTKKRIYIPKDGIVEVTLPPFSSIVIKNIIK